MTYADNFVSSGSYKIIPRSKYFAEQAFEDPVGLQNVGKENEDKLVNNQNNKGLRKIWGCLKQ